jgi:hypothetical protein
VEPLVTTTRERDLGQYLGLVGRWAWAMFALYAAIYTAIAIVEGIPEAGAPVSLVSLGLVLGAALLISSPSPTPLPRARLLAICALVLAPVGVMLVNLPTHLGFESLVAWQLSAVNFVLFVLELRARVIAAWILVVVIVVVVAAWSVLRTGTPWLGVQLTYGQVVSLAAGTVFAIGLQRTARQVFAQQDAERVRAADEAARSAGDAHRAAELAEVRALAGPLLQAIASGAPVDRRDALTLEAALRDRIRGRGLSIEPLVSALRRARERDVDALVLDDLGDALLAPDQAVAIATWCAERIDALPSSHVTIRLAPTAGGAVVSIADAEGIVGELKVPAAPGGGSASTARRAPRRTTGP